MAGVPIGFVHNWAYHGHWREKKVAPGLWKGTYKATKHTKAKGMGPKPGSTVEWEIKGNQKVFKTKKGSYNTNFVFTKKLKKARIK